MMKRGQIWIETVLYTLIGLSLIALALVFITPKISQTQDRLAIEQTMNSLNELDSRTAITPGNVRHIDFGMKRGELIIDGEEDKIYFVFNDISYAYSEPGVKIDHGRIDILTEENQKDYTVTLYIGYSNLFDLKYEGEDSVRKFNAAPTPYKFSIKSTSSEDGEIINIEEIS